MLSIIVLEEGSQAQTDLTLNSIRSAAANCQLITIGKGGDVGGEISSAIAASSADKILMISSGVGLSEAALRGLMTTSNSQGSAFAYAALQTAADLIDLPDHELSSLPQLIGTESPLPFSIVMIDRSFAMKQRQIQADSMLAYATQLYTIALSANENIERLAYTVDLGSETPQLMSMRERAAALKFAAGSCNIEDLFPNHAWAVHHEESASASYHSLAAIFIRLQDFESAQSCLSLSDQLEDSPRSLAMKGMIALHQGEVLIAVANLVSSLQQYEMRKKNSGEHYLSFNPSDLNEINASLCQGLEALNKRENKDALGHFAEAVFNFDSFYKEFGLDGIKNSLH